ncbi:MAG: acyl-CoA carboxylase subunit beta, partial [Deinococcus sp.]|nr:acyl-CoA carboxylase subunit beta [Deinococcus sp.]
MQELTAEMEERRKKVESGGGAERIEDQHRKGKLTARERLQALLDPGSFVETGVFVEHRNEGMMEGVDAPGEGVVTGYGKIDGRQVFVFSQDFTVMGGSLGERHAAKICQIMDLAVHTGCPIIGLNDSAGARIQEGVDSLSGYGQVFYRNAIYSGVVPQLSVIMGPCAGGAVYSPAITDFTIMVDHTSYMFITGPDVVKAVTGEEVTFEDLGGAGVHNRKSGVAHFLAGSDSEALALVRRLFGFLPQNAREKPPVVPCTDPISRSEQRLLEIVHPDQKRAYPMDEVIRSVVDDGDFLEVHALFARNIITGLARLAGRPVGIVANQPRILAGTITIDAANKAARFIRTCDAFNIPLVTFVDVTGFMPGTAQEHGGIIRHGA